MVINEPEYVFSQGVGINIVLSKEKKDSGNNTLRQLGEMGARMIKLELPTNDKINLLMESSITHYIFTIKLDAQEIEKNNESEKREFYNKIYSQAKDLITRRGTSGKTIFIGTTLSLNKNVEQSIDWINVMVAAIDDARSEVKYTRCKIYSYTFLDGPGDAYINPNPILTKLRSHYISCQGDELRERPLGEVKSWLNNLSSFMGYRSELSGIRVFISEGGFTQDECGGDAQLAQKKNLSYLKKLFEAGVPYVFLKRQKNEMEGVVQNLSYLKLKDIYAKQIEAAQEMKSRRGRYPTNEEMLSFTATLF